MAAYHQGVLKAGFVRPARPGRCADAWTNRLATVGYSWHRSDGFRRRDHRYEGVFCRELDGSRRLSDRVGNRVRHVVKIALTQRACLQAAELSRERSLALSG